MCCTFFFGTRHIKNLTKRLGQCTAVRRATGLGGAKVPGAAKPHGLPNPIEVLEFAEKPHESADFLASSLVRGYNDKGPLLEDHLNRLLELE